MRHIRLLLALALLPLTLCGCSYVAPVMPPGGLAFASIQAPIDTNADQTPVMNKVGESTSKSIMGLIAWGDASVQSAALNGGLRRVHHVDYEYKNYFFTFFQKFTIRTYGE